MYDNQYYTLPVGLIAVCGIAFIVIIAAYWKIFTKAGEKGWKAIIPIYNIYVLLKIVGKPGWWLILFFLPVANLVALIWTCNMLSKSFGKDEAFTVGLILLSFIFIPVLGFGSAEYLGPFGDKQTFENYSLKNYEFGKE